MKQNIKKYFFPCLLLFLALCLLLRLRKVKTSQL
mgnify:CR=1 FL=1